jgi:hypothetical protein
MTVIGRIASSVALLLALIAGAAAAEVRAVPLPAPVAAIHHLADGAFVETADGRWRRIAACPGDRVCLRDAEPRSVREAAPAGGLPDGSVASAAAGDIRRAWYVRPTTRYAHAVLGDAIEAGGLVVETARGQRLEFVLDDVHVFEDMTPRIADLDGDGANEVVTIRASRSGGAAIAVFGLREGRLALLDATADIGRPNRWLNVAAIADLFGIGRPVLAWVETPHIGGTLRLATFADGRLAIRGETVAGVSNHAIGSRELGLSAVADIDGDGRADLVLPTADRRGLVLVGRAGAPRIALPGAVAHAIAVVDGTIVTATTDGTLLAVTP